MNDRRCPGADAAELLIDLAVKCAGAWARGDERGAHEWANLAFHLRGDADYVDEPDRAGEP